MTFLLEENNEKGKHRLSIHFYKFHLFFIPFFYFARRGCFQSTSELLNLPYFININSDAC